VPQACAMKVHVTPWWPEGDQGAAFALGQESAAPMERDWRTEHPQGTIRGSPRRQRRFPPPRFSPWPGPWPNAPARFYLPVGSL